MSSTLNFSNFPKILIWCNFFSVVDEYGDLVMEVGIDRILRFSYKLFGEIHGYRCVPCIGGPSDHHVSIELQRWYKMRQAEEHVKAQIQEILSGNSVESKVHLGGLYFIQVSSRYSNVQIRQYAMPNTGPKRLYATKFGISMSIPEYAYFSCLVEEFTKRIKRYKSLVPCFTRASHSDSCVECYPLKKHMTSDGRATANGGGKRFMMQPGKRTFPFFAENAPISKNKLQ